MLKKIFTVMIIGILTISLVGCSFFDDDNNGSSGSGDSGIEIKTVDDFAESNGLIKYFTVNDLKFAIPETVGEYANYLSQLGTVTLNDTGNSVEDEELEGDGISSMAAYLTVTTDDGVEGRFYVRYENPTEDTITVAEASVTYIEVKYDIYAENEYDKAFSDIEVVTENYTFELNDKRGYKRVYSELGNPVKDVDGRLEYDDDAGYAVTFDCCNENRNGVFRGFIIEYPTDD